MDNCLFPKHCVLSNLELDALADEPFDEAETEGHLPSYLRDSSTTALPDFVDSEPVMDEVSCNT